MFRWRASAARSNRKLESGEQRFRQQRQSAPGQSAARGMVNFLGRTKTRINRGQRVALANLRAYHDGHGFTGIGASAAYAASAATDAPQHAAHRFGVDRGS